MGSGIAVPREVGRIGNSLSERILLRVRATTGHVGVVRAAATALAARLDYTYDRITDLHIAIDEVCGRILATSDPPATHFDVTFTVEPDALRVEIRGDGALRSGADFLNPWSKMILEAIAEDLQLHDRNGSILVSFQVAKGMA
jgi:anti-sigma regulatory factor (Ser/Thr protein kinase)